MSELINILEQVKKKIPMSKAEKVSYKIMQNGYKDLTVEDWKYFLLYNSNSKIFKAFYEIGKDKKIEQAIFDLSKIDVGYENNFYISLLAAQYAYKALKNRWIEAENIIKKNNQVWETYCDKFSIQELPKN